MLRRFVSALSRSGQHSGKQHDARFERLLLVKLGIARGIERFDESDLSDGNKAFSDCDDILHGGLRWQGLPNSSRDVSETRPRHRRKGSQNSGSEQTGKIGNAWE
jgi:hypothetical protein